MSKIMENYLRVSKRILTLRKLQSELCGAATQSVLAQSLWYKDLQKFDAEIVAPLIASGYLCVRGQVLNITDAGLLSIGIQPDVPSIE